MDKFNDDFDEAQDAEEGVPGQSPGKKVKRDE